MTIEDLEHTHFQTVVARELLAMVLGPMIGEGIHRCVYPWLPNKRLVAKVEPMHRPGVFANVEEYQLWQEVKDNKALEKWLAPVYQISGCGLVMLQYRTTPIREDQLPRNVPRFFCDLKPANWGMFRGRPVCHDYGLNNVRKESVHTGMKKADWRL